MIPRLPPWTLVRAIFATTRLNVSLQYIYGVRIANYVSPPNVWMLLILAQHCKLKVGLGYLETSQSVHRGFFVLLSFLLIKNQTVSLRQPKQSIRYVEASRLKWCRHVLHLLALHKLGHEAMSLPLDTTCWLYLALNGCLAGPSWRRSACLFLTMLKLEAAIWVAGTQSLRAYQVKQFGQKLASR